jgi:stringent starvation protein B
MSDASTKPYLIRAIHEWCSDNGFTPYLAVAVDQTTQVPREYVRAGEIVLNVSLEATNKLQLGNEYVEFQARFGGQARDILIPIANVTAIYARENGHGMSFEVAKPLGIVEDGTEGEDGNASSRSSTGSSATSAGSRRGSTGSGGGSGKGPASSVAGARGLASVKPSTPPVGTSAGPNDTKRASPRKLKSVSTGERPADGGTIQKNHGAESLVSEAAESTSDSGNSKIDQLVKDANSAGESQEPTRTASAPRPVAEPRRGLDKATESVPGLAADSQADAKADESKQEGRQEGPSDPSTDPTKPTSGKPKLTRVK